MFALHLHLEDISNRWLRIRREGVDLGKISTLMCKHPWQVLEVLGQWGEGSEGSGGFNGEKGTEKGGWLSEMKRGLWRSKRL